MTTTPLPPHAISTDHPAHPKLHWTREELAWIAARDKQFLTYATQTRADLEAENQRLREALRIAHDHIDMNALRVSHCKDAATITAALESKP